MNLNLNYEGFEQNLVRRRERNGGIDYKFRFENNYGASVVKHSFSYGSEEDLWELAVTRYYSDDENDWNLVYDTDITGDVEGHLTDEDVRELLNRIKELN